MKAAVNNQYCSLGTDVNESSVMSGADDDHQFLLFSDRMEGNESTDYGNEQLHNQIEYLKAEVNQLQVKTERQAARIKEMEEAWQRLDLESMGEDIRSAYDNIREAVTAILVSSSVLTESEI